MTVRIFTEADLSSVMESVPERDILDVHQERLALQARGGARYFLALSDGSPAGWVQLMTSDELDTPWRVRFECAEVIDLYVSPPARGRGLGRELMHAIEGAARDLGWSSIGLSTAHEPGYSAARHLYEELGYIEVTTEPWIVGWVRINEAGERLSDFLILDSFFLKHL